MYKNKHTIRKKKSWGWGRGKESTFAENTLYDRYYGRCISPSNF